LRSIGTAILTDGRSLDGPARARGAGLYDVRRDPTELTNIYRRASPTLVFNLSSKLDRLKRCAGAGPTATSCKKAEGG
jgi:hypothetical protein